MEIQKEVFFFFAPVAEIFCWVYQTHAYLCSGLLLHFDFGSATGFSFNCCVQTFPLFHGGLIGNVQFMMPLNNAVILFFGLVPFFCLFVCSLRAAPPRRLIAWLSLLPSPIALLHLLFSSFVLYSCSVCHTSTAWSSCVPFFTHAQHFLINEPSKINQPVNTYSFFLFFKKVTIYGLPHFAFRRVAWVGQVDQHSFKKKRVPRHLIYIRHRNICMIALICTCKYVFKR